MAGRGGFWGGPYTGARPRTSTYTLPVLAQGSSLDIVEVPSMPGLSPKILEDQVNARFGTVTHVNNTKNIGYLRPVRPLPPGYDSSSLFFHFNVIKNTYNYTKKVTKGTTVKFILYEAKEGNTENLSKPKAFAVFTYDPVEEGVKDKARQKEIQRNKQKEVQRQKAKLQKENKIKKQNEEKERKQKETKRAPEEKMKVAEYNKCEEHKDSKKVSVFWDIENCRPKKGKVLDIVQEIRDMSHGEGFQEQTFMAVCDVTRELKGLIRDLESSNVNVMNRTRKKNSSDEILRQQMRKVVDTNKDPGRIILISGDSDFSTDLHSFRYVKMYETILIHNDKTTAALIKVASKAIPFKTMNQFPDNVGHSEKRKKKKTSRKSRHPRNHSGWTRMLPDSSGWFCGASKDPNGCRRGLMENAMKEGKISSEKYVSYVCNECSYRICDLCNERYCIEKELIQKTQNKFQESSLQ
eukprot:GFUD01002997.1.p1 GENE.GFUD01002997.1~~GFUD01002997.1.p1  ORF type:complete len:465 (-),score=127.21 GFUD01002997.1:568-1962(-)